MAAKRNKTEDEKAQAAAAAAEAEANAAAGTETPNVDPDLGKTSDDAAKSKDEAKAEKPAPINADKMAAEIKVSGNSYQQYARQMFKDRLEANR